MATRINTAQRNKLLDDGIDFDGGTLYLRTGAPPASAGDALTGTDLGSVGPLPTPALAAAVAGVAGIAGDWEGTAVATGTVGYGRLVSASGDRRMDVLAGAELTMADYDVVEDGPLVVTDVSITMPAG